MRTQRDDELLASELMCNRDAMMAVRQVAWDTLCWRFDNFDRVGGFIGGYRSIVALTEESLNDWPGDGFCPVI